jgi:hypothetical protein
VLTDEEIKTRKENEISILEWLASKHGYVLLKIDPELQLKDDDA